MAEVYLNNRVWFGLQGSSPADAIAYPAKPTSTGAITTTAASSWGPLDWLQITTVYTAANINFKIFIREGVGWGDKSAAFAANKATQYTEMWLIRAGIAGAVSCLRIVGEIWGWQQLVDTSTTAVLYYGGKGSPPPW